MPEEAPASPPPAESARARILAAAMELFAAQGFGATPVKEIARRAGVSQGLMYTYFDSKDDLLRAIFEEGLEDVRATLPGTLRGAGNPEAPAAADDPLAAVEELLRGSFATVERHEHLWRLLYALRVQPAVLERIGVQLDTWAEAVEAELRTLCEHAGLEDPATEAKLLFAVIDGANQHRTLSRGGYPVEELIAALMRKYRHEAAAQAGRGRSR